MGYSEFCDNWSGLCREYGRAEVERMHDEDPTWGGFMVDDWFDNDYPPLPNGRFNKRTFKLPGGSRNRRPVKTFPRPPRGMTRRFRRLENGKVIFDGSPIGFVAEYCPVCDGMSIVTGVDPEFINFKCAQCGKRWYRPSYTVEFDMRKGIVYPDIVNTVAGAYQLATKKAMGKRRVKTPRKKQTNGRSINVKKRYKKK